MNADALNAAVVPLLHRVAQTVILPRWQTLASHEVDEKSPGEVVTIADRQSEELLGEALGALLPEARIIGEEQCDAQPALLDGIDRGIAWLIDPLDGTRNFTAGVPHFAVMVALVCDGETHAGWILDPLTGRMCHARRNGGAFVDGEPFRSRPTGTSALTGALPGRYADPEGQERLDLLRGKLGKVLPGLMCAGADYPRCADGTQDFAMFWRSLPWDHAAGALFLTEAGGKVGWPDGEAYRVGDTRPGLIAASTPAIWDNVVQLAYS